MKRQLLFIVLLLAASSTLAGSARLLDEFTVPGASKFHCIDPILDQNRELIGFVYSDYDSGRVLIDFYDADTMIVCPVEGKPEKTINTWVSDSLVVFTLSRRSDGMPGLARLALGVDSIDAVSIHPETTPPSYALPAYVSYYESGDISFDDPVNPNRIYFNWNLLYSNYEMTIGWESDWIPTSSIFDLSLNQLRRQRLTKMKTGVLSSTGAQDTAKLLNGYHAMDYNDPSWPSSSYYSSTTTVRDKDGIKLAEMRTGHNGGYNIFVGDFNADPTLDEFIYFGSSNDLLNVHGDTKHLACYSFAGGVPEELWYIEVPFASVSYVYEPQHMLAGMWKANWVALVNYWRGTWCDTVYIDHNVARPVFFQTDIPATALNLAGTVGDTVYVYQFDTPTDVEEPGDDALLPGRLQVEQNYPNPFNSSTRISFATATTQHVTMKVYNALGQYVATLFDRTAPPGSYHIDWDGHDRIGNSVASGVYFVRVRTANEEEAIIKAVYLK